MQLLSNADFKVYKLNLGQLSIVRSCDRRGDKEKIQSAQLLIIFKLLSTVYHIANLCTRTGLLWFTFSFHNNKAET